jgi:predicted CopG family antitoxin
MAKDRESITIDHDVNDEIKAEAKKQRRSFSGMIEFVCSEYLRVIRKQK